MTHFWACTPTCFFASSDLQSSVRQTIPLSHQESADRWQLIYRQQRKPWQTTTHSSAITTYFLVTRVMYSDQIQTGRTVRAGRWAEVSDGQLQSRLFQLYANSTFSCQLTRCPLILLLLPQTLPLSESISWIHSIRLTCRCLQAVICPIPLTEATLLSLNLLSLLWTFCNLF